MISFSECLFERSPNFQNRAMIFFGDYFLEII